MINMDLTREEAQMVEEFRARRALIDQRAKEALNRQLSATYTIQHVMAALPALRWFSVLSEQSWERWARGVSTNDFFHVRVFLEAGKLGCEVNVFVRQGLKPITKTQELEVTDAEGAIRFIRRIASTTQEDLAALASAYAAAAAELAVTIGDD